MNSARAKNARLMIKRLEKELAVRAPRTEQQKSDEFIIASKRFERAFPAESGDGEPRRNITLITHYSNITKNGERE